MGALTIAALSAGQQIAGGFARREQLKFQAEQNLLNAERSEEAAAEVARAGQQKIATYSEKAAKFAARSEAVMAKKHIDLGSGLAEAVRRENERAASLDLLTIQNNISNDVLRMKFKAGRFRTQAGIDRAASSVTIANGIIKGAISGATSYVAAGGKFGSDPRTQLAATPGSYGAKTLSAESFQVGSGGLGIA